MIKKKKILTEKFPFDTCPNKKYTLTENFNKLSLEAHVALITLRASKLLGAEHTIIIKKVALVQKFSGFIIKLVLCGGIYLYAYFEVLKSQPIT